GAVGLHCHLGIAIGQDAGSARAPREGRIRHRRGVKQHRRGQIGRRADARRPQARGGGGGGPRGARGGGGSVRVLVDEAVRRARQERQLAPLQALVDAFDGRAGGDEAQTEQVSQRRAVGGEER